MSETPASIHMTSRRNYTENHSQERNQADFLWPDAVLLWALILPKSKDKEVNVNLFIYAEKWSEMSWVSSKTF